MSASVVDLPLGGGQGPRGVELLGWVEGSEEVPHLSESHTVSAGLPSLAIVLL